MSLTDVARLSRTSLATVSRVLSDSDHPVSEATRKRVREAALSLGYQPNAIARALATRRTRTIGLIVGDISDPYFGDIARGVEEAARPNGYLTIICNSNRSTASEVAHFRMLMEHKVAAVVFAGGQAEDAPETDELGDLVARAEQEGRVVMALAPRGARRIPTLAVDNRAVAYDMTCYLAQLGHRSIAFVGGPEGLSTNSLRLEGFRQAMTERDLDPSWIYNEGFALESGRQAAAAILARPLPDAILAANDHSAIGLLLALRASGIDVPRQVSVAGIDDLWLSTLMDLTTVHIPKFELGAMAARQIVNAKDGSAIQSVELPHQIMMRGSTGFRSE